MTFRCPGCGNTEAFIYAYSDPPDPLAIALSCKRCEASWRCWPMDDVWWTTPGPPRLSEAQAEAASLNDRMVHDLFQVILRELDGCTIADLIDVAGLIDR